MSHVRPAALPVTAAALLLAMTACSKTPNKPAAASATASSAITAPAPARTASSPAMTASSPAMTASSPAMTASSPDAMAASAPSGPTAASDFEKSFLTGDVKKTASGVEYADVKKGTGIEVTGNQVVEIEFQGFLGNGTPFDSTSQHKGPMCVTVGDARGMKFFNEGLIGMKQGGTRRLLVTPENGYGAAGRPPVIPPNSTVLFEVTAKDVRPASVRPDVSKLDMKMTPTGLRWADVTVGTGPEVKQGGTATVLYSGWLDDGTKFDSSADRCQPYDVEPVGHARVIAGWNEGLVGMKKGGKRVLIIPAPLAYGASGRPPLIGPDATLTFVVDVTDVQPPLPAPEPMDFPDVSKLKMTTTASGLQWTDLKVGTGAEATPGSNVLVHYTGWFDKGGEPFDSSLKGGQPLPVGNLGHAQVIAGWNEGLVGMKEGGRRVLYVKPELAYGATGYPPVIPPNATLVFIVQLMKVKH